jgi:hypothetical protein
MKKLLLLVAVFAAVYLWERQAADAPAAGDSRAATDSVSHSSPIAEAFDAQQSGRQVRGEGVVTRILADDHDGSRHQRFILELDTGQTLLIAHNIDLAPRIGALREGDSVSFNGVYEWNDRGGIVHWTHHDPEGQHEPGWLRHNGRTYE